jgi:ATP-binding cassette, subfamily C (CFTR/MRP), member 1
VQRRVGICSSVLRSMKSVKLTGLVVSMSDLVQSERVRELQKAKQFRILTVWVQLVSNLPTTIAPMIAFAAYVIKADIDHTAQLTTAQAFTALSVLTLLTAPTSQLLGAMPTITAGMGCVRRIHAFISSDAHDDKRDVLDNHHANHSFTDASKSKLDTFDEKAEKGSQSSNDTVISFNNVILPTSGDGGKNAITFEAGRGTLTTVLGPVGCGKSTLLRCVLGEIQQTSGDVSVASTYIGYCSQSPWIPNERIRASIIGPNDFDEPWYREVIKICELESDFSQMPENDLTITGSRGIVLSGGQKHRIVSTEFVLC